MAIYNDNTVKKEWRVISKIIRYTFFAFIIFAAWIRITELGIVQKEPYKSYYSLSFVTVMFFYIVITFAFWIMPKWFKNKVE